MDNVIKVGLGVLIKNGDKILLGHRAKNRLDTGGIFEPDSWTIPGGKQEYNETIFEAAIREIKEETNLDISNLEVFGAEDDIQPNKHYISLHIIAHNFSGDLKVMEPTKEDEWRWFNLDNLPKNIYTPTKKFLDRYLEKTKSL